MQKKMPEASLEQMLADTTTRLPSGRRVGKDRRKNKTLHCIRKQVKLEKLGMCD